MRTPYFSHPLPSLITRGKQLLQTSWITNKPLTLIGGLSLIWLVVALIGLLVDPTLVINEPVWRKPAKFAISIALYSFTFLWLLRFIEGHETVKKWVSWLTAVAFLLELIPITLQATRGVRSHFNNTTPFDAALFSLMGASIMVLWLAGLVAAVFLLRQPMTDRAWGWSLKFGLLIALIGGGLGGLMTMPTAEQMTTMEATGTATTMVGAHSVGVEDGSPGLPIVGWSTTGGDLRGGHFIGLHALQVLPLLGWIISQRWGHLSIRRRTGLVATAAFGYLGIVGITTWQALRGQSLIAPDGWTLLATGLLLLATGLMAFWLTRGNNQEKN